MATGSEVTKYGEYSHVATLIARALRKSGGKYYLAFNFAGASDTLLAINSDGSLNVVDTSLSIPQHDYKSYSYTNGLVTQIVYKSGGATGTTVATKTITYNGDGTVSTVTVA